MQGRRRHGRSGQGRGPRRRGPRRGYALLLVVLLGGCDSVLQVDTSGVIVPGDLDAAGPAAIPTVRNGMVGAFHAAYDDVVRYSALLTDEMVLAGTFPDRLQVDRRRILESNASMRDELYEPVHVARFQADTTVVRFTERLTDPAFAGAVDDLREGIALAELLAGYTRIWLGELFCWSILTGVHPETAPRLPEARMEDALVRLEAAEADAEALGLVALRDAARVGQARALLWLGRFGEAAALAALVPRSFEYQAEYGNSNPDQYNQVYTLTWGDTEGIRWTIGDGTSPARGNERWEHLAPFVDLGLVRVRPSGFASVAGSTVPVILQERYRDPEASIVLASGVEARLLRAEVHVRTGETQLAQDLLNDLRGDFAARAASRWGVPVPSGALPPLTLTGALVQDLKRIADERARELWLTGDRLTTSRRLRLDPVAELNLFPNLKAGGGDDMAFPIPLLELEANPHLGASQACPAGQAPGSWR